MSTLRIAAVGGGYFSQFHYDAWGRLPVDLVGVCDLDINRARQIATDFASAEAFDDAVAMIDALRPDLLDVIVPPAAQVPIVEAAIDAGVAVICQKPFTPDLASATALTERAQDAGVMLIEGERGVIRLDGDGRVWLRKHAENNEQLIEFDWQDRGFAGDSVYRYQAHVLAHLQEGKPLANGAHDYLRNMQIVEAVYRSNDLGQWQTP